MELKNAVQALAALAHEGRLAIFRTLVVAGPSGLTVGEIAKELKMPGATLSFHLSQLKHAGLVAARRDGRRLIQTADFVRMNWLITYLSENCCGGAQQCTPACKPSSASDRKPRRKAE
jgi:DNA-binding transcriptional ArsR family regulator